jgi:signal transduction histidine kinase
MTTIMGFSELLTSDQLISSEQQQEYLSYIFQKSEDMPKILDDLLDISRIESGRELVLHIEPLPIGPLIEQAVTPYRLRFTNRRFETVLTEPNRLLQLDRGKFAQIMENLLSNAVKYIPGESNPHQQRFTR